MPRKMLLIQRVGFAGFSVLLLFSAFALISSKDRFPDSVQVPVTVKSNKAMVVMELFTSQGCSSCPPADALLAEYVRSKNEHIIPLSFHVDYWNRLGWADPFSNGAYSERQQWYSRRLPKGSVYTPQLIVNGNAEAVGNNRNLVKGIVEKALTTDASESITVDNILIGKKSVSFHYASVNTKKDQVLNIALVQKEATTEVRAGENDGVTITNRNIVRSFITQTVSDDGKAEIELPASFATKEYALVLYIQNRKDLSIGAALIKNLL